MQARGKASLMPEIRTSELERYLKGRFGAQARLLSARGMGGQEDVKGYGYGHPLFLEFEAEGRRRRAVLSTMREGPFGHEDMADRAQVLLWQYHAFNRLPRHVRALDVGALTCQGELISAGPAEEFFLLTEFCEGEGYFRHLERIREEDALQPEDLDRARSLARYLVEIHRVKHDSPNLYARRIRDLVGHGEGLMGLTDSYPDGFALPDGHSLEEIERQAVRWRWRIKGRAERLSQVHGDFHPWNVLFTGEREFMLLDRSRGEWGEPADDLAAMTINYLFFSLQRHLRLAGPWLQLWDAFWREYLEGTGDRGALETIAAFYAWRGLVVGSPLWYPDLPPGVREAIFRFIFRVLEEEAFSPERVREYLE